MCICAERECAFRFGADNRETCGPQSENYRLAKYGNLINQVTSTTYTQTYLSFVIRKKITKTQALFFSYLKITVLRGSKSVKGQCGLIL